MRLKFLPLILVLFFCINAYSFNIGAWEKEKKVRKEIQIQEMQNNFKWWPTDATPGPVQDNERGGYWWWPERPGTVTPWGNRGYVYLYKIIFDYKEEELPPPKPKELRPSLLIKKIIKNVKIYFDYDRANLRDDHIHILEDAVKALKRNSEASILITGNCDRRGTEFYNLKLGKNRADAVRLFLIERGISEERIIIVSKGKLDAIAVINDLTGMQKDRNAQFMIAEVEEVMIPYPEKLYDAEVKQIEDNKFLIEKEEDIESDIKVSTKEYVIKKGDSLWKIAEKEYGGGYRWKYLYELNKEKIKDPNNLKEGIVILIPVE